MSHAVKRLCRPKKGRLNTHCEHHTVLLIRPCVGTSPDRSGCTAVVRQSDFAAQRRGKSGRMGSSQRLDGSRRFGKSKKIKSWKLIERSKFRPNVRHFGTTSGLERQDRSRRVVAANRVEYGIDICTCIMLITQAQTSSANTQRVPRMPAKTSSVIQVFYRQKGNKLPYRPSC